MPLQNRVDPCGAIIVTPCRGTMMGNRGGALHNDERVIVRQFKSRQWIACVLEFKGRRRTVMSPNRYTELFFLDEAVALAAGHRPCAECRRERFNAFRDAWTGSPRAPEMDLALHAARIDGGGHKITWEAPLHTLPDGCFIRMNGSCYLVRNDELLQWSAAGYLQKQPRPNGATVTVLTPEPMVACIRNGYKPSIHDSAGSL